MSRLGVRENNSSPSPEHPPSEVIEPLESENSKRKFVIVGILIVLISVSILYVYTNGSGTGGGTSFSDAILITDTVSKDIAINQDVYYKFWKGDNQRAIVTLNPPPYADFFLYNSGAADVENKDEASQFRIDYKFSLGATEPINAVATGPSGYYYVYIGNHLDAGSYKLSVSLVPLPTPAPQGGSFDSAITYSGQVYENAVENQSVFYKFWVNAGENFTFDAVTSSYDSFIIVYGPDQTQMRSFNSWSGGFQNVESSGYYFIEIWNRENGWYQLSVSIS